MSVDSSGNSAKFRLIDLNALRNAQIGGGAISQDKKSETTDAHVQEQPSFERLLNDFVNGHLELEKASEVAKSEEKASATAPERRPQIGMVDGFKHDGSRSDWSPLN